MCLRVSPVQPRGGPEGLLDRGKVYGRHALCMIFVPTMRSRFALNIWNEPHLLARAADDSAWSSCDAQSSEGVKAKASCVFDKDEGRLLPACLRYRLYAAAVRTYVPCRRWNGTCCSCCCSSVANLVHWLDSPCTSELRCFQNAFPILHIVG